DDVQPWLQHFVNQIELQVACSKLDFEHVDQGLVGRGQSLKGGGPHQWPLGIEADGTGEGAHQPPMARLKLGE
ncbi:MAG: hypothetical protein LQ349_008966, partial [Xanthoria aureola]